MVSVESRVEGLEQARRALSRVLRAEGRAVKATLTVVGQQAVSNIRAQRRPWRTGDLLRSYDYEVGEDSIGAYVDIGSNLEYAPYQEFGTRYIAGTPHLRPGIERTIRQVGRLIAEGMARAGRGAV